MTLSTCLPNTSNIFIGIDVDKKSFSFTVKDDHHMNISKRIPADPKQFLNYIKNTFADQKIICAYESGPTGFYLHDYL